MSASPAHRRVPRAADACPPGGTAGGPAKRIRTAMDCADVRDATASVLSRHTGYDAGITRAVLQACADEHAVHADTHEHRRVRAEVCRRREQARNEPLASLGRDSGGTEPTALGSFRSRPALCCCRCGAVTDAHHHDFWCEPRCSAAITSFGRTRPRSSPRFLPNDLQKPVRGLIHLVNQAPDLVFLCRGGGI